MQDSPISRFDFLSSIPNFIILCLISIGAIILVWVGFITWNDIAVWNKDIGTIFFGSRTGEAVSLGIGMIMFNYLLIGGSLLTAGILFFLRNRMSVLDPQQRIQMKGKKNRAKSSIKNKNNYGKSSVNDHSKEFNDVPSEETFFSGCQHHFGYLASRPKDSAIPPECIICQRLGDCMVATVYIKKVER
jgi:hypothetical protein